ncbi:MAG: catalase [Edaphobacter sp.]|nr:catalase [Edaphobacter sp.]
MSRTATVNGRSSLTLRSGRWPSMVMPENFNFREDDHDYYSQPGNLFRMLKPDERQRLFQNTAHAIGDASKEVRDRHIGNCSKADPAYGEGVAKALAALEQDQESEEIVYAEVLR